MVNEMDEQDKPLRIISGEPGNDAAASPKRPVNTTPLFSLRSIWPDVLVNLERLLAESGELKLAATVDGLMVFDGFCDHYSAFVHTQPWNEADVGPTHRTIHFSEHGSRSFSGRLEWPTTEFLTILEIVDEQIVSIDIMDDRESKRRLLEALPDADRRHNK
jgi:hypothetical protein